MRSATSNRPVPPHPPPTCLISFVIDWATDWAFREGQSRAQFPIVSRGTVRTQADVHDQRLLLKSVDRVTHSWHGPARSQPRDTGHTRLPLQYAGVEKSRVPAEPRAKGILHLPAKVSRRSRGSRIFNPLVLMTDRDGPLLARISHQRPMSPVSWRPSRTNRRRFAGVRLDHVFHILLDLTISR